MYYSGKFSPKNYSKYKGNPTKIEYRSSWELKFMNYCDMNSSILEWSSEEIIIPYFCPVQNKYRRYFVDFYIKVVEKTGDIKKYLIEIKPKYQLSVPNQNPKKKTKRWITENTTYATNQAKWKAAKEYCEDRLMEFKILTEDDLNV
jgi:hypothetical protein